MSSSFTGDFFCSGHSGARRISLLPVKHKLEHILLIALGTLCGQLVVPVQKSHIFCYNDKIYSK